MAQSAVESGYTDWHQLAASAMITMERYARKRDISPAWIAVLADCEHTGGLDALISREWDRHTSYDTVSAMLGYRYLMYAEGRTTTADFLQWAFDLTDRRNYDSPDPEALAPLLDALESGHSLNTESLTSLFAPHAERARSEWVKLGQALTADAPAATPPVQRR